MHRLPAFLAVMVATLAPSAAVVAQGAPRGLAWGASGALMAWTAGEDPFDRLGGPGVQLSYLASRAVGFEVRVSYFLETGFYGLSGPLAEAAVTYGIPAGPHLFQVKAGATGMFGGDSDGSIYAGGGPYGGGGVVLRIAGRFGIQLDALGRVFVTSGRAVFAPGGAVALVLLPRGH